MNNCGEKEKERNIAVTLCGDAPLLDWRKFDKGYLLRNYVRIYYHLHGKEFIEKKKEEWCATL